AGSPGGLFRCCRPAPALESAAGRTLSPLPPGGSAMAQARWKNAGWVLVLACTLPGRASADDAGKAKDKPEAADKLGSAGQLAGVVKAVGGTDGGLTLRVGLQLLEANPGAAASLVRQQQELLHKQAEVMRTHNPALRYQRMAQFVHEARHLLLT